VWAIVLIVVAPAAIIAIGELEERLRQRDSVLTGVVSTLRRWTIPLFTVWAVARGLLELEPTRPAVRVIGTLLLLSGAVAALQVVKIVVASLRARSRQQRRGIPALVLALPRVAVIIVTLWVLVDGVWGVDLTAAMTALGVTSLVVSFALQDTLSGLASGLLLLSDAPFQPGDWIRFGDIEGRVIDINWRSSRIEDRNGDLVVIPNAQLAGATLVNYDEPARLHRVVVPVQVAFANPPTLAKEMLLDAARGTPGVLDDPPPRARVVQIDDPLMGYEVDLWIDDFSIAPRVRSDFGSLVWYQSERHGVPLPSPAYDLYVYDGPQAQAAGKPDLAELRRRLRTSALLAQLDSDDLGRLAAAARAARYAAGEVIVESEATRRDFYLVWSGRARLVFGLPDGEIAVAGEFGPGDVFGQLSRVERVSVAPRVVAVTDCEVVAVDEAVAGLVASRNPALSEVLNQLAATRRRRIERMLEASERLLADETGNGEPEEEAAAR
jgi:small-conductance mechanosensitive channel/CRP-like cAMP-binding protein